MTITFPCIFCHPCIVLSVFLINGESLIAQPSIYQELRLLHGQRTGSCLDIQPSTYRRVCTTGLELTKCHWSSQHGEFVYTKSWPVEARSCLFGSIADKVYFLATYQLVEYTQTTNDFVLVPKSSHRTFASLRICVYRSVIRHYTHKSSVCREVPVLVSIQGR